VSFGIIMLALGSSMILSIIFPKKIWFLSWFIFLFTILKRWKNWKKRARAVQ
jgi:hypothetical protein